MSKPYSNNIQVFADICKKLDCRDIYHLVEDVISDKLHMEILAHASADSPEPVRSALIAIGMRFNVPSLINY